MSASTDDDGRHFEDELKWDVDNPHAITIEHLRTPNPTVAQP
jgi:hypothetical protein